MLIGSAAQLQPTEVVDANPDEMMTRLAPQMIIPHLPVSSHLLHIKTGRIFQWMKSFAERSDIYMNCDSTGNTDPKAWEGTQPGHWRQTVSLPEMTTPEGFRQPGSIVIDSRNSPLGAHLPDTLAGGTHTDRRESALPVPTVDAPMDNLMAALRAQLLSRWQEQPNAV